MLGIDLDYFKTYSSSVPPPITNGLFTSYIFDNWSDFLPVYTDGFKTDIHVGVAFVIPSFDLVLKFTLLRVSFIFTTESEVIFQSLHFILLFSHNT